MKNTILQLLLISLGVFSGSGVLAQQFGQVKGHISTADGKPAGYVTVGLQETTVATLANEDGSYRLNRVKPGTYTLRVSAVGLESQEKPLTVLAGQMVTVDFILNETSARLQEVVVQGSRNRYKTDKPSPTLRLDAPLLEVPQNIQVITATTLADQQVTSMSDGVLRNVSGATRLEHWGDVYTRVNTRGARAAAFRNGMNVTSNWGPLTEDMSFVDHVEFVKGPSGFMMSNGEPSGIYNVVTKKPTGRSFNGQAGFTLGSFDLYRTTLDLDGKFSADGKLLYRLNLMGQTRNSHRPYEFNDRYSVAPVVSYRIDDNTTLTAEYNYQHVTMSDLGSAYVFSTQGYATLPRNFTNGEPGLDPSKINDHSLFLNLQHQLSANWKLTAQAAYFNYQQRSSDIWPGSVDTAGNLLRNVFNFDAAQKYKFGQVFVNGQATTGRVDHRILAGLDLGTKERFYDWGQIHALDSAGAYFNIHKPVYGRPVNGLPAFDRSRSLYQRGSNSQLNQSYTGFYAQDELGFFDNRIRLTLAGRFTDVRESSYGTVLEDSKFTPRVGLSVSVNRQTSVYGLYDQTFIPQTGVLRGGQTPKPITGNNVEFGLKKDWLDGRWNTTVAAYRIIKNNELSADPTSTPANPYSLQLGQSKTEGVEFDLRGEILTGLSLVANYAYTDSRVSKEKAQFGAVIPAGTRIAGYAKHNANAWLSYKLPQEVLQGLGFSGGLSYLADHSTWSWGGSGREQLPEYFRLDGGAYWEKNKLRFTANVFNILDEYLFSGASYSTYYYWQTEAPRNYRFSIGYKF